MNKITYKNIARHYNRKISPLYNTENDPNNLFNIESNYNIDEDLAINKYDSTLKKCPYSNYKSLPSNCDYINTKNFNKTRSRSSFKYGKNKNFYKNYEDVQYSSSLLVLYI